MAENINVPWIDIETGLVAIYGGADTDFVSDDFVVPEDFIGEVAVAVPTMRDLTKKTYIHTMRG